MSALSIKSLFKPHLDVLAYLQDAGADPEYSQLKQLFNQTKETQQYHLQNYSIVNLFSDENQLRAMVNYVRAQLKKVREFNHSLQQEIARSSHIDSRSTSTVSGKATINRPSQSLDDVIDKFISNYREGEVLTKELQELHSKFQQTDYISEEIEPSTKEPHKWIENLDFEMKCLRSEITKLSDPHIRGAARNKLAQEYDQNEPLQTILKLQSNYTSLKVCFNTLLTTIEELIVQNVKGQNLQQILNIFSRFDKQMFDFGSVSAASTLRVFSKQTTMSINIAEPKEAQEFQMLIQEQPSYENVLSLQSHRQSKIEYIPPEEKMCCSIF